jgi:hypothetical protein
MTLYLTLPFLSLINSVTVVTPMATRAFSRLRNPIFAAIVLRNLTRAPIREPSFPVNPKVPALGADYCTPFRLYHDGRPRGPLWRGKKLIGKEALFVILGLKRFKDDEEKLEKFIKSHVLRLLKMEMIAVLGELERQEEVSLAVKVLIISLNCAVYFTLSFGLLLNSTFGFLMSPFLTLSPSLLKRSFCCTDMLKRSS